MKDNRKTAKEFNAHWSRLDKEAKEAIVRFLAPILVRVTYVPTEAQIHQEVGLLGSSGARILESCDNIPNAEPYRDVY